MIKKEVIETKICDCCGKEVDYFLNSSTESYTTIYKIVENIWYGGDKTIDTCKDCQIKIIKFIKSLKENDNKTT